MAWSWDGVSIVVEAAFGDVPQLGIINHSWTDITDDVREISSINRGRQSEHDDLAPGTLAIVLDNSTRKYDPDNTAGTYYGDLVPSVPIRVEATVTPTEVILFQGYVQGWPQVFAPGNVDSTVTVIAVDSFRWFNDVPLPGSAYEAELDADNPDLYYTLQTIIGDGLGTAWTGPSTPTDTAPSLTERSLPLGAANAISGPDSTTLTGVYVDVPSADSSPPKALEWWMDATSVTPNALVRVVDTATNGLEVSVTEGLLAVRYSNSTDNVSLGDDNDPVYIGSVVSGPHHYAVTADASNVRLYVDGVLWSTTAHDGTSESVGLPALQLSATSTSQAHIGHVAAYSTAPSAARIAVHHDAGRHAWAGERAGDRIDRVLDYIGFNNSGATLDTGTQIHGPYLPAGQPVLDYIDTLNRAEQGIFYFDGNNKARFIDRETLWTATSSATFTDDGNTGDVVVRNLVPDGNHIDTIRNVVTVSYAQTGGITRRDSTSITNYGEVRELIEAPTLPSGEAASNVAAYVLRERKDPGTRVSAVTATLRSQDSNSTQLLGILQRDLGDLVTVEYTPVNTGSQVVKTAIILGLSATITPTEGVFEFYLSPRPTAADTAPYLTLGDATDGKIGTASGNLIPG